MSTWSDGYVVDIPYTTGFYRELTPGWLRFSALLTGHGAPPASGFAYAELGCGLGHGTALMAACNPDSQFYGFDFNPQQIGVARRFATAAGLENMHFMERSFEQLAADDDNLPQFDYIVMHGIWTWVSEENRRHALTFIARHLKPNGMVYVSYNTNVGWQALAPVQRFMRDYAATLPGSSAERASATFEMVKAMSATGAVHFTANPQIDKHFEKAMSQDGKYLAHEYLNGSWYLPGHAEVRSDFATVKCDYVASAVLSRNFDELFMAPAMREFVQSLGQPVLRETYRDFATNNNFRRDIFVRGLHPLTPQEIGTAWDKLRLLPLKPPGDGTLSLAGTGIGIDLRKELTAPLLEAMASQGSLSLAEALALPNGKIRNRAEMQKMFAVMIHVGAAHPVFGDGAENLASVARFNRAVHAQVMAGHELSVVALPRHATGIALPFSELVMIDVLGQAPGASRENIIAEVWRQYQCAGRRPARDGKGLFDAESALARLHEELPPEVIAATRQRYTELGLLAHTQA